MANKNKNKFPDTILVTIENGGTEDQFFSVNQDSYRDVLLNTDNEEPVSVATYQLVQVTKARLEARVEE